MREIPLTASVHDTVVDPFQLLHNVLPFCLADARITVTLEIARVDALGNIQDDELLVALGKSVEAIDDSVERLAVAAVPVSSWPATLSYCVLELRGTPKPDPPLNWDMPELCVPGITSSRSLRHEILRYVACIRS